MQIGIFAKTFAGETPGQVFAAAHKAGFECVQYNFACSGLGPLPQQISEDKIIEIKAACQDHGISIAAISATYNMIDPMMDRRKRGRWSFMEIAKAASELGVDVVTVCTGSRDAEDQWRHHRDNISEAAWAEMIEEFEHLLPVAKMYDIKIGVEPEMGNVVSSAERARRLLDHFHSPHIGIVFDAANLFEKEGLRDQRSIIEHAASLLAGRIVLAHAKDRTEDGGFTAAGLGSIDWPHYAQCLRKAGYDGAVITHGLAAAQAPQTAKFLRRHFQ